MKNNHFDVKSRHKIYFLNFRLAIDYSLCRALYPEHITWPRNGLAVLAERWQKTEALSTYSGFWTTSENPQTSGCHSGRSPPSGPQRSSAFCSTACSATPSHSEAPWHRLSAWSLWKWAMGWLLSSRKKILWVYRTAREEGLRKAK